MCTLESHVSRFVVDTVDDDYCAVGCADAVRAQTNTSLLLYLPFCFKMSGKGPKRCYYEVLEIEPSADEDDIKRAYRKVCCRI